MLHGSQSVYTYSHCHQMTSQQQPGLGRMSRQAGGGGSLRVVVGWGGNGAGAARGTEGPFMSRGKCTYMWPHAQGGAGIKGRRKRCILRLARAVFG